MTIYRRLISLRLAATHRLIAGAVALGLFLSATPARTAEDRLTLLVQPVLSSEQTIKAFTPLCEYIAALVGQPCRVRVMPNFIAYWDLIRRDAGYDFVLDAAHFTDYRIQKLGFDILAKIPDTVSYSLIVREENLMFDPAELTGKRVATLGPPSIGAARLAGMFPNPVRQPIIIDVESAEEGMRRLIQRQVDAAILPTPVVSRQMAQGGGISVVMTTEPIPHIALSASPRIDAQLRRTLRQALVTAEQSETGRRMLKGIGFPRFDPASPEIYVGQSSILKEYWGY